MRPIACILVAAVALASIVSGCSDTRSGATDDTGVVASVTDGDTVRLRGGDRVRLIQIDAPEVNDRPECGGEAAADALRDQLPPGTRVRLEVEPDGDRVDDFGRLLRYVHLGDRNVNLWLVERGLVAPYFYRGQRGRYAAQLERAARTAERDDLGLWGDCPRAQLNPERNLDPGPA